MRRLERELEAANARRRRERWAQRYRPDKIDLLLVAEAPPSALDRYFYFPQVATQDSLFRYIVRSVLGREPDRSTKADDLERLHVRRVFLIDACQEPLDRPLESCVPSLLRRVRRLNPNRVILIKASVYDAVFAPLQGANLPVVDVRVPFPGSGNQVRFERAMRRALRLRPTSAR